MRTGLPRLDAGAINRALGTVSSWEDYKSDRLWQLNVTKCCQNADHVTLPEDTWEPF